MTAEVGAYVAKRLATTAVVFLLVFVVLALLPRVVPGDPARVVLGPFASEQIVEEVREQMGLNKSPPQQVLELIVNAVQGDLGKDFVSRRSVTEVIGAVLPYSLVLTFSGLALAVVLGVPLGVLAALRAGSWLDRLVGVAAVVMVASPAYVVGLLLLIVFAVNLGWLPAIGAGSVEQPVSYLTHLLLPALTLALEWVGFVAKLVRGQMVDVLRSQYIRTARAYGLPSRRILLIYALRNALTPAVALLGMGFGHMLGYAVFAEVIFSRPGLGTLLVDSISLRNYPVVRGVVLIIAFMYVLGTLTADVVQRLLSPKLRQSEEAVV